MRSAVVSLEGVRGITVCLDVPKADGSQADTTLVPFGGRTLAAGTDWKPLSEVDNAAATPEEIKALREELAQWYPELAQADATPQVCIKTERDTKGGRPDVTPAVFGREELGVTGLTVAFPGKASFMFELARKAAEAVHDAVQQGDAAAGATRRG